MTELGKHEFADVLVERVNNPRWQLIDEAADFIVERIRHDQFADLMFVCTHNSRRSQFAHAWAHVFSKLAGLEKVRCYSGGTEVTECNQRTIASLKRFGFVVNGKGAENPVYDLEYPDLEPFSCSSSLFASAELTEFAAMMCCSDVDEKCPLVPGAAVRIPLHYEDPKVADDTPQEVSRYDERCRQIGRDMLLLMFEAAQRSKDQSQRV